MKKVVIYGAAEIVTMAGKDSARCGAEMSEIGLLKDHAIIAEDGVITAILPNREVDLDALKKEGAALIDADGACITPGFVDSHTHFIFGGYRAEEYDMRLKGRTYMEIMNAGGGIAATVKATREASAEELYELGRKRLDSMMSFGVTTVEGKSGYGLAPDHEFKQLEVMKRLNEEHPVDVVPTFMGPHALPEERKTNRKRFMRDMINMLPEVKAKGLAKFADVFCEDGVFTVGESREYLMAAKQVGLGAKIHADEIVSFGGAELAAEVGAISAEHLLKASDEGIMAMKERGVIATLLPLTAFSLKESYARGRYMIDQGMAVALATDFNPGSCFSECMPLMIALATIYMKLSLEETLSAITINGAAALGIADKVGSLAVGKQADLLIHEFPSYKFLAYHFGVSTVKRVVKGGELVYERAH